MDRNLFTKLHGGELIAVLAVAFVFLSATLVYTPHQVTAPIFAGTEKSSQIGPKPAANGVDPFASLNLSARAVYVYDVTSNKTMYAKNEGEALPLASLTKIQTASTALGLLKADSKVSINKNLLQHDGDINLYANEWWNLKKLIEYTLTISSNEGATSIAAAAGAFGRGNTDSTPDETDRKTFIERMNADVKSLGLEKTVFYNESGLDENMAQSGAYGSAQDVATFFAYAIKQYPDVFEATRYPAFQTSSLSNISHTALNTNSIITKIPGIIASKTGFTDLAGGNLAVAYDAGIGRPIIIVVLGSTYSGRFEDMEQLVKATNQALSLQNNDSAV